MPVPACGSGRAREGGLERGGGEPSSEAEPARGSREPSSEAEPVRGGREPSSGAEPARGSPWLGHSGGSWGPPRYGPGLVRAFKWEVLRLRVLSRIPQVVLGDPQGCPRQKQQNILVLEVADASIVCSINSLKLNLNIHNKPNTRFERPHAWRLLDRSSIRLPARDAYCCLNLLLRVGYTNTAPWIA
jgi:hypothetical protein